MTAEATKRGRGRPKGSKNKPKVQPVTVRKIDAVAFEGKEVLYTFTNAKCGCVSGTSVKGATFTCPHGNELKKV